MQDTDNGLQEDKKMRMQAKAILCVVVIGLLFWLGIKYIGQEEGELLIEEPQIEYLHNIYIENVTDTYVTVFDGESKNLTWKESFIPPNEAAIGRIADITLTDGKISDIVYKDYKKINEKVLSIENGAGIELENAGYLAFSEDVKIYLLYGELRKGTVGDIRIGYNFADLCIEDGKICAVLLTRDENMEYIRVLIKSSDYASNYHQNLTFNADSDFVIRYGKEDAYTEELFKAGEEVTINSDSVYFEKGAGRIKIIPNLLTGKVNLLNVNRSQGIPAYRGTIEVQNTQQGLVVINEVLLEEYLYSVVPSEMPASYPLEALKAQAICARTYAYSHMMQPGIPSVGAHVDDSTGYQVYNNITEQTATTTAVKETAGQLLYADNAPVSTYYYSTSCGFGSDEHVWRSETAPELPYLTATSISKEAVDSNIKGVELASIYSAETMKQEEMFAQFLDYPTESHFEENESWYRWWYDVMDMDSEKITEALKARYAANSNFVLTLKNGEYISAPVEDTGAVKSISVVKRGAGGVAEELVIEGEKATYKVITELFIRYVLCDGTTQVKRQDGSMVDMTSLLPSGYFVITPVVSDGIMEGYKLYGGGFGHGVGMSQNGAKNMANIGYTAEQILTFFYKDSILKMME